MRQLDDETMAEMLALRDGGMDAPELARRLGLPMYAVYQILLGGRPPGSAAEAPPAVPTASGPPPVEAPAARRRRARGAPPVPLLTVALAAVEFRPVPGFPGYRVGSDRSVWSSHRGKARDGTGERWKRLRAVAGRRTPSVNLYLPGEPKTPHARSIAALCRLAFLAPPEKPPGPPTEREDYDPADEPAIAAMPAAPAVPRPADLRALPEKPAGHPDGATRDDDDDPADEPAKPMPTTAQATEAAAPPGGPLGLCPRARGAAHPRSRIVEADVVEIRRLRAAGSTLAALAGRFGITPQAVDAIAKGRTWRHVGAG